MEQKHESSMLLIAIVAIVAIVAVVVLVQNNDAGNAADDDSNLFGEAVRSRSGTSKAGKSGYKVIEEEKPTYIDPARAGFGVMVIDQGDFISIDVKDAQKRVEIRDEVEEKGIII